MGAAVLLYALDFALFHIRIATNRNAYGSVTVNHYYAILQKNGKTNLIFDPPQAQTCVNAAFPHGGFLPCWYLSRHPRKTIVIGWTVGSSGLMARLAVQQVDHRKTSESESQT